MNLTGVPFHKMTGSGNDFVFLDGRDPALALLETADAIRAMCGRGTGIGADGVVWLMPGDGAAAFRMRYRNSDGSLASMCGNAALCSVSLATRLGFVAPGEEFAFQTDAGLLTGRIRADGLPEVTLTPVQGLRPKAGVSAGPGEHRVGFADSGVPHLVVEVGDAESVDLAVRGRQLRFDPGVAPAGANVNFVSKSRSRPRAWRMRTYERGVEGETLACGTGAAASAAVLRAWHETGDETTIETTSGLNAIVSIRESNGVITPSLAGEGRIVFEGRIEQL